MYCLFEYNSYINEMYQNLPEFINMKNRGKISTRESFRDFFSANSFTWRLRLKCLTGVFRFVKQGMGTMHVYIAVTRLSLLFFFPSLVHV